MLTCDFNLGLGLGLIGICVFLLGLVIGLIIGLIIGGLDANKT